MSYQCILLIFTVMDLAIDYKLLCEQKDEQIARLNYQIASLTHQLNALNKMVFGSKHERFVPAENSSQLSLDIQAEAIAQVNVTAVKKIEYTRSSTTVTENKKEHPGRTKLPEHLERREIIVEPAQDVSLFKKIGEEITEELEYEPGKLFVNRIVRPKYAKPDNGGIVTAPMIERPLPKAIAGPALLANIAIEKYVDHLPLYRQMERFKREGVNIAYSTITDWLSATCRLITPLYEALKKLVLQSNYLHADESPIKVLDKDKQGTTHRGYFWVYQNSVEMLVYFDYQEGRGREGPQEILKDFKGHLQTDGYPVYDYFKQQPGITVLHCMAHARRMFFDALENDPARAEHALQQFGLLYDIERKAKNQSLRADERMQLRQTEALPVLIAFEDWLKQQYIEVAPKSAIAKAISYCITRWQELKVYTTHGKLNIDNNPVENSIRPVAVGRKNYLFAGSHEAAKRSAMLYSLLVTCKLHCINPSVWLTDIIKRISSHPINKIEELLPNNWIH
jgi:transposase